MALSTLVKPGFHPNARNVRDVTKWRHYWPITAANDDSVCRWHAA